MSYKLITYEFADITDDDLFERANENPVTVINEEIEKLKSLGIHVISVLGDYDGIVIESPDFKIDTSLLLPVDSIKDCDSTGQYISQNDIIEFGKRQVLKKQRLNWLINQLKNRGIHTMGNLSKSGSILKYSCPICNKDNEKMGMYLNSFFSTTYSKTDCIDEKHQDYFKTLQEDLIKLWKEKQNPDFTFVKWDENFVIVTYKDKDLEKKVTTTLKKYNELFDDYEQQPEITKFNILDVQENTKKLLEHYKTEIKYNIIKRRFEIFINGKKTTKNIDNYLITIRDFGIKHNYRPSKEKIEGDLISIGFKTKYNPIEDYLKTCHAKYLQNPTDQAFKDICETVKTNEPDKDWYLYHSFLQMVYMGCRPEEGESRPIESQFLPVFQGGQGSKKTTWFRSLLPKHLQYDYFQSLLVLDVGNKDHLIEISSNWLVEIGEISSTFKKSDQDSLKAYITNTKDRVRIPYAKEHIDIKRRTCFCGTTNDYEYLRDLTGSRRFLTMGNAELVTEYDIDIDLLWGYFYDLYLKNTRYWHEREDIQKVEANNNKYLAKPENIMFLEEQFNLFPLDGAGKYYSVKEMFNMLSESSIYFSSHIALGKALKKYNVKFVYNKARKTNEYYVEYLNEIIDNKF
jgi:hypothetical protein